MGTPYLSINHNGILAALGAIRKQFQPRLKDQKGDYIGIRFKMYLSYHDHRVAPRSPWWPICKSVKDYLEKLGR
jgi:hypothetical protein